MSDVLKSERISVRLPAELRQRVKDAARQNGVRESDVVRQAVERQFAGDKQITAYERAKKVGLIGAVRGASPDLSTSKRHFDGFGKT